MKRFLLWPVLLVFLMGTAIAAPKYGGTLVFGVGGDAVHLDPGPATDGNSINVLTNIYNNLVEFKYGTTEVVPALAVKWEISANGMEYTFHLRKGVKFHKTKYYKKAVPFTADDVVFSLKRQMDKNHPFFKVSSAGKWIYWSAMDMSNIIKDIKKVDKYTVKITLAQLDVTFLSNLGMHFAGIVSKQYAYDLKKKGKEGNLDKYPIATGPFKFVMRKKDDRVILEANKAYWGGRPYLNRLIFRIIPNNSVRAAELRTGAIQIMDFPSPSDIAKLGKDRNLKLVKQEGLNVGYLAFNVQKPPFDDVLVRKAVALAVNRKQIIKAVYEGMGRVAKNPLPPTMAAYNDDIKDHEYNPKEAKRLLKLAGFPRGFSSDLWAMPVARPYMPNARKVAEVIQADLAKIGIKIKIVSYEWGTYLSKTRKGEHPMCLLGWTGDNGDPDNFLYVLLSSAAVKSGSNRSRYMNGNFDRWLDLGKKTADPAKRIKYYRRAQEIVHKDIPWLTIAHSIVVEPMRKNVKGFKLSPLGLRQFKPVWIDK